MPGMPQGFTDVTSSVVRVTDKAKRLRASCTRATRNIEVRKGAIKKAIDDLKKENEDREKHIKECTKKLGDLQTEVRQAESALRDANAEAKSKGGRGDQNKLHEMAQRLQSVTSRFNTEQKLCTEDEDNVDETNRELGEKNKELAESINFVMVHCQQADAAENEVAEKIDTVTQVEVVNRLYQQYNSLMGQYSQQEK